MVGCLCALFHPDYDRRLWNYTRSAVTPGSSGAARGLGACAPYRRWGVSPRPENTPRLSEQNMADKPDLRHIRPTLRLA